MKIEFGAMAPQLSEQIEGLDEQFDIDADCITRLLIRRLLTDSEVHKARKRLIKQVEKVFRRKMMDFDLAKIVKGYKKIIHLLLLLQKKRKS